EAITDRDPDKWIIHFGERSEAEASRYEAPFSIVVNRVKPVRDKSSTKGERENWWKLARRAPDLFSAISGMGAFIVTPEVSKHRCFTWLDARVVPDKNLVVIARDDLTTFGILHSYIHALWSLRLGSSLEDRPRYTSSTTFRTFPFPKGLTPSVAAEDYADDPRSLRITEAARELVNARERWLNPPEWTERVPEVVTGYPDRVVVKA